MNRSRSTTVRALAVVFGAAFVIGACGISEDEDARAFDEVPFELLGTSTSTTSTTVVQAPQDQLVFSFFWHTSSDNRLIRFDRVLAEAPTIQEWIDALVDGPLPEDVEEQPDALALIDPTLEPRLEGGADEDGVHRITINRPAEDVLVADQAAELVCTVLQFPGVERVAFQDPEGLPVEFSNLNAEAVENGATEDGFNNCEPQPVPTEESSGDDGIVEEQEGDNPAGDEPAGDEPEGGATTTTASG